MRKGGLDGVDDEAQVGFALAVEWRGHADKKGVHLGHAREVSRCSKALLLCDADLFGRDALDVAPAVVELQYLGFINVEAEHLHADFGKA